MNLVAQLLPQFISELPVTSRRLVYAALTLISALALADYKFAAGSGIPWIDSHVVSASVLAWILFVVIPILVLAHKRAELPAWEEDVLDAVDPALTTAAAPAVDIPNQEAEAALQKVEPVVEAVAPVVEAAAPAVAPVVADVAAAVATPPQPPAI